MRIGVVVLVHEYNDAACDLISRLSRDLEAVAIHVDADASAGVFDKFKNLESSNVTVLSKAKVAWGEWGMVEATTATVSHLLALNSKLDYVGLLSGSCYPIRNLEFLDAFLEVNPIDYIECHDIQYSNWVKGGLQMERIKWWFPFNFKKRRGLFQAAAWVQKKLQIERKRPKNYSYAIGSQWCFLRVSTWHLVLKELAPDTALTKFMKYVWVPDEIAIQTIVKTFIPTEERCNTSLTLHQFMDHGRPVTFYNGQHDLLSEQGFFFARKISPQAVSLRRDLDEIGKRVTPLKLSHLGERSTAMWEIGNARNARVKSFPKMYMHYGSDSQRGRCFTVVFASTKIAGQNISDYVGKTFSNSMFLGRISSPDNRSIAAEINRHLDMGEHASQLLDSFPHCILSMLLDKTDRPPVIVVDERTDDSIIERLIKDTYAQRVLVLQEGPVRSQFDMDIGGRLAANGSRHAVTRVLDGTLVQF